MSKKIIFHIILKIVFLFVSLLLCSYCILTERYTYLFITMIPVIFITYNICLMHKKIHSEFEEFMEALRCQDFSRHFNIKTAPPEVQFLRRGFNSINESFKNISKEKETQHLYLQKILELVDTGILSFEESSGEVMWMNESLKKLLGIPFLSTIHALSSRNPDLLHNIRSLKPGEPRIVDIAVGKEVYKVLLSATFFQTENKKFHFIAFQNINKALDETETKAWQKLLGVLTHEIMNSIAPISSLADTIRHRLNAIHQAGDYSAAKEDLSLGIDIIRRRSEGLLLFAEKYRNLTKISKPVLKKILVRDLFENIYELMEQSFEQKKIELDIILKDPHMVLEADENLVEQVLINLMLNATEALKERAEPRITFAAFMGENEKAIIKVSDNGTGIPDQMLDKIFIPFFSTRKNGNGIGLTLCKQIMLLHQGSIQVQSKENEGSIFTLQF